MNTESEFQLTLPSNASITFSPDNKPANYTTTLPSPISLEGEWEVALIDIQYPHNWMNITKDIYLLLLLEPTNKNKDFRDALNTKLFTYKTKYEANTTDEYKQLWYNTKVANKEVEILYARLPKGYYANVGELISTLNEEIQDSLRGPSSLTADQERTKELTVLYRYNPIDRRVQVFQTGMVGPPEVICLDNQVKSILDQANPKLPDKTQVLTREKLLLNTIPSIYIYTDIIKYQYVGDVKVPLLGVLPVQGLDGEQQYWSFNPPYYIPVAMSTLSSVNIHLADDKGDEIPFVGDGKVVARLHFRRVRGIL